MENNIDKAQEILLQLTTTMLLFPPCIEDRPLLTDDECRSLAVCNPYSYQHIRGIFPDEMFLLMIGITAK